MKDLHKDNPQLKEVFYSTVHNIRFYAPIETAQYHTSRYVAAGQQNIYSASGATKDYLDSLTERILDITNNENNKDRLRSDIASLTNNLKYRLKYPVDEDCAIRMGAIYSIAQDEPFDMCDNVHTDRKMKLAKGSVTDKITPDPDLYTFFLTLGVHSTPSWQGFQPDTIGTEYFRKRMNDLNNLMPLQASKA